MSKNLHIALIELGEQLEKSGWTYEDEKFLSFDKGEDDPETNLIVKAKLFLHQARDTIKKFACLPEGGVKPTVKVAPDYVALAAEILQEQSGIRMDTHYLVDVLIHLSLEQLCASPQ